MKMFDFHVRAADRGYEAIFSRVWLQGTPPPQTGLWWCQCERPSARLEDWSEPVQLMTAAERGWHSGPWKPSAAVSAADPKRLFVFFSGLYSSKTASPYSPFVFTLGCVEVSRPETM
jgi:hypothetical protein